MRWPTVGTYISLGRWHRWLAVRLDRKAAKHEYLAAAYFYCAKVSATEQLNAAIARLRGSSTPATREADPPLPAKETP